jgi:hypothetical protein
MLFISFFLCCPTLDHDAQKCICYTPDQYAQENKYLHPIIKTSLDYPKDL